MLASHTRSPAPSSLAHPAAVPPTSASLSGMQSPTVLAHCAPFMLGERRQSRLASTRNASYKRPRQQQRAVPSCPLVHAQYPRPSAPARLSARSSASARARPCSNLVSPTAGPAHLHPRPSRAQSPSHPHQRLISTGNHPAARDRSRAECGVRCNLWDQRSRHRLRVRCAWCQQRKRDQDSPTLPYLDLPAAEERVFRHRITCRVAPRNASTWEGTAFPGCLYLVSR
jgi:hypothetical protein